MSVKILMPAMSPTMKEGTLSRWLKSEGDDVIVGDILVEIETDKATMEVEAVDDGVLGRILVEEGSQNVPVNEIIGILVEEGDDLEEIAKFEIAYKKSKTQRTQNKVQFSSTNTAQETLSNTNYKVTATPLATRIAKLAELDLLDVIPSGKRGKIVRADVVLALQKKTEGTTKTSSYEGSMKADRMFVSPLARRIAAEANIDLALISGSGPNGRIIASDLKQHSEIKQSKAHPANQDLSNQSELIPISPMRRVIAKRMVHSKSSVPHFYLTIDCEIDKLIKLRGEMKQSASISEMKLSINDFVIRACALALMEIPKANVSFENDEFIRKYRTADISVAVAIDGGLLTPIVRNAEVKSVVQISNEISILARRAREGQLKPDEFNGGSFSISNLGMYGIKQFDAIINEPQGAILAVGAASERPVVKNGRVEVATIMTCTLSCDHRVIDGAVGAELLGTIKKFLEKPSRL